MKQDIVINNDVSNPAPFLTIGIANYNYGRYLRRGFEAIQRQKFHDIELIYADNNSTDDSRDIIQEFMKEADIPICLITGGNIGVCGNRNRILKHARGTYLMLCDADDWMTDDCLETLCSKAMETGADQVIGAYQKVDDSGKILYRHFFPDNPVKWSNWGFHASLYRMEVIKEHKIQFDLTWCGDDAFFSALFHKYSKRTVFLNKALENWCKHNDSVTSMYAEHTKKRETTFNGAPIFRKTAPFMAKIWKDISEADQEQLEYMWTVMYYYGILYRRPAHRFKDDLEEYKEMCQVMLQFFPNYLHNKALRKPDGKGYCRKKVAAAAFFLAFLERIHLIRLALWGYWVLTHFYKLKY